MSDSDKPLPVPEEVGGDVEDSPGAKLPIPFKQSIAQMPRKSAETGRIVVTLHYTVPRDTWEPRDVDAVDVLRRMINNVEDLSAFIADQTRNNKLVVDIDLEAAK